MKRNPFLLFFLFSFSLAISAHKFVILGYVIDDKSGQSIEGAALRLMKMDSTFVGGEITDSLGRFKMTPSKAGNYILKISLIGYHDVFHDVVLTEQRDSVNIGKISLRMSDVALKGVDVKTYATKVFFKNDTLIFNASAYRLQPGSMLGALIRKLPGVTVDDDGNVKVNGKTVSEIKINGKDFFKGNTIIAMKNLPADLVGQVKTYEENSKESKHLGIEDAKKKTVLDITLKRELKSTLTAQGHTNLAPQKRYDQQVFLNEYTDKWNASLYSDISNASEDDGFDATSGLNARKNVGFNLNWTNQEENKHNHNDMQSGKVEISGSGHYDYNDNDVSTISNEETFFSSSATRSYSNSASQNRNKSKSFNGDFSLEWTPDTMDFVNYNLSINKSRNANFGNNNMATFNDNPYQFSNVKDPLTVVFPQMIDSRFKSITVNTNKSISLGRNTSNDYSMSLLAFHKLDTIGNLIGVWLQYNVSHSRNKSFTINNIQYYQLNDSTPQTFYDQYVSSPSTPHSFSVLAGYVHHFTKNNVITFLYKYGSSYNNQNRFWYELDSLQNVNADRYPAIGWLPTADSLEMVKNFKNSQYTVYRDDSHSLEFGLQLKKGKFKMNPNLKMKIQRTHLHFSRGDFETSQTRTVNLFEPSLFSEYKFSEQRSLRFNYNANSSAPDMLSLIDLPDESHPLYVTRGNKNLKNSWQHSADLWYNSYNVKHQESFSISPSFNQSFNNISNKLTYDASTGKRISQPANINGDWSASVNLDYSRSLGKENMFTIQANSSNSFSHSVGYTSTGSESTIINSKNVMRTLSLTERFTGNFRTDKVDASLSAQVTYNNDRGDEGSYSKMNTAIMTFQAKAHWTLPWKMDISSDFGIRIRRGYADSQMNTTECLWNARLSQSFLKKRNLTFGLRFSDILHQRKYFTREITATSRSEIQTNHVGSYFMFQVLYNFNILNEVKK